MDDDTAGEPDSGENRLDRRAWERKSEGRRLRELAKGMAREHETSKKAQ